MGLRGPIPKSAEERLHEGSAAHRPLPAARPHYPDGAPERPKGMTAAARRVWDAYMEQMAPLGILRLVDVFALQRLCEDVAMLQELQAGMRQIAGDRKKAAKAAGESTKAPMVVFAMTHEGRRLTATINSLASRIGRQELQFGLTPVSAQRLEGAGGGLIPAGGAGLPMDPIEEQLCG